MEKNRKKYWPGENLIKNFKPTYGHLSEPQAEIYKETHKKIHCNQISKKKVINKKKKTIKVSREKKMYVLCQWGKKNVNRLLIINNDGSKTHETISLKH